MCTSNSVSDFWRQARLEMPELPEELPQAWAFGATPEHADELLALVLAGTKIGTASSKWDYEASGEALPQEGELSIILDSQGNPAAIIETYEVRIIPFNEVSAEHAHAEGEGDLSLEYWRAVHEDYWRKYSENSRGFASNMPVLCERFRLIYQANAAS